MSRVYLTENDRERGAASKIRVEYAGKNHTLQEWAEVTGKPVRTLYNRIINYGWPVRAALMAPVNSARRAGGQSPVQKALELADGSDWTVALSLAITLMAVQDYQDRIYRDDVRQFFCAGLFEELFALDGRAVYAQLQRENP